MRGHAQVVFSDLHVSKKNVDVCMEVLHTVHREAVRRDAGILFLGKSLSPAPLPRPPAHDRPSSVFPSSSSLPSSLSLQLKVSHQLKFSPESSTGESQVHCRRLWSKSCREIAIRSIHNRCMHHRTPVLIFVYMLLRIHEEFYFLRPHPQDTVGIPHYDAFPYRPHLLHISCTAAQGAG